MRDITSFIYIFLGLLIHIIDVNFLNTKPRLLNDCTFFIKTPAILIIDGSDVEFYHSLKEVESTIEPPDVNEGLYQVYDSEGHLLQVGTYVVTEENPWWLGGPFKREIVKITDTPQEKARVDELKNILKRYYRGLAQDKPEKLPIKVDDQMGLKELIDISAEYKLFYPYH